METTDSEIDAKLKCKKYKDIFPFWVILAHLALKVFKSGSKT